MGLTWKEFFVLVFSFYKVNTNTRIPKMKFLIRDIQMFSKVTAWTVNTQTYGRLHATVNITMHVRAW